jgi:dipeptidyl aminopeptidase/acylaminoacyl peptidase
MGIGTLGMATLLTLALPAAGVNRPMSVDDLLAVRGVADPQVSPDGTRVVYVHTTIDREANKSSSDLWMVPVNGGEPKRLTTSSGNDSHPRWKPDGKMIAFTSDRGGPSQIYLLPLDGGEARALTKLPIDVSGPIWSPDGSKLAFAAEVYTELSPEATAEKDKKIGEEKSNVKIFDRLMIRHWTSWDNGKRSHIFVCDAETGEATDLTPSLKGNAPPGPFGGSDDYTFSPDGRDVAFTAEPLKDHAWSTNTDIWVVPTSGGEPRNATEKNLGADAQPRYLDDETLCCLSQSRAGFEADQWILKLLSVGAFKFPEMTSSESFDRSIHSFRFSGKTPGELLAAIDDRGTVPIVRSRILPKGEGLRELGPPEPVISGGMNSAFGEASSSGKIIFTHSDAAHPTELFVADSDGANRVQLTHHNDPLLSQIDLAAAEGFTFRGSDGDRVSGWLIKPPGFDRTKKYPVLFLIHGGPQGAWHDEWHARWNYGLFAAPGYVIVAVNPRGSTGYGQKFTDQISGDWSGRVYEDLMTGLDYALMTYDFLDESRVAAAGGSFGGYMANWIEGHTDRFRCLISHAGVYDLNGEYGATEELWFPEWEFGGTPWEKPETYRAQSPSMYAADFRTPMLVIHGALDFRVPDTQGIALFTALQRHGVPSRLVYFPDEGHWITKPANRVVWWNEVHEWLAKYLKPSP